MKANKFLPLAGLLLPCSALAARPIMATDSGHAAWMLIASILVLMMTLPGIILFYGGLVRRKNVLSIIAQCVSSAAIMSLLWVICGYSLSFDPSGALQSVIGGLDFTFLHCINLHSTNEHVPTLIFILYQLGFAVITTAIITGGCAERVKFSTIILFLIAWEFLVYYPVCHWIWGSGWLQQLGVLDFAGGTVVHINSGVAGLVAALILGKRLDYHSENIRPHNITLVAIGAGLLWVGWFGFNGGSAPSFAFAAKTILISHMAACAAALTWMASEWILQGKPTALGLLFGGITGLVAITPACGYVGLGGAMIIGAIASLCCMYACGVKYNLGYDDPLDAFGVHGLGGIIGSLLTGIFAAKALGGVGYAPGMTMLSQLGVQALSVGVTILWSGIMTYLILTILSRTIGLRVSTQHETLGLDITHHGEQGYGE